MRAEDGSCRCNGDGDGFGKGGAPAFLLPVDDQPFEILRPPWRPNGSPYLLPGESSSPVIFLHSTPAGFAPSMAERAAHTIGNAADSILAAHLPATGLFCFRLLLHAYGAFRNVQPIPAAVPLSPRPLCCTRLEREARLFPAPVCVPPQRGGRAGAAFRKHLCAYLAQPARLRLPHASPKTGASKRGEASASPFRLSRQLFLPFLLSLNSCSFRYSSSPSSPFSTIWSGTILGTCMPQSSW